MSINFIFLDREWVAPLPTCRWLADRGSKLFETVIGDDCDFAVSEHSAAGDFVVGAPAPSKESFDQWALALSKRLGERRVYRAVVSLEIPGVLMVRAVAQDACVLPIPRIAIDVLAGRPIRDPRTPLLPSDTKRLHVIRHERPVLDDTYLPFWEWMTRRHERVTALRHWFPTVPYEDAGYYEKCVETDE